MQRSGPPPQPTTREEALDAFARILADLAVRIVKKERDAKTSGVRASQHRRTEHD